MRAMMNEARTSLVVMVILATSVLSACGPVSRSAGRQPGLPSGVARPPDTATTVVAPSAPAVSGPASAASELDLLVLHTNDTRGYTLPCG